MEGDPAGGVGLLQSPALGHPVRAIEDPDVVHPEEATLEEVGIVGVLAVDPPAEVEQQLGRDPDEEVDVPAAVELVDLPGGPGVHGRVDVGEGPLVSRQLTAGMLRPFPADQPQLVLGEGRVDVSQRHAVESQVPRGEPRVLPLVGHRDDVGQGQMSPRGVASEGLRRPS